ncbi:Uncharacterised protein [Vibrio cholerae]|nr:Uncharacterised protein [Vibrio cholerae]
MQLVTSLHFIFIVNNRLDTFDVNADAFFVDTIDSRCLEDVDFADKTSNKEIFWIFVDFTRRAVLFNFA